MGKPKGVTEGGKRRATVGGPFRLVWRDGMDGLTEGFF